jgi:hypothetical protein
MTPADEKLVRELGRYGVILQRLSEDHPGLWDRLASGTGLATPNGYFATLRALDASPWMPSEREKALESLAEMVATYQGPDSPDGAVGLLRNRAKRLLTIPEPPHD